MQAWRLGNEVFCLIKIVNYLDGPKLLTIPKSSTALGWDVGIWEPLPFFAPWFPNTGPGLPYGPSVGQCGGYINYSLRASRGRKTGNHLVQLHSSPCPFYSWRNWGSLNPKHSASVVSARLPLWLLAEADLMLKTSIWDGNVPCWKSQDSNCPWSETSLLYMALPWTSVHGKNQDSCSVGPATWASRAVPLWGDFWRG